MTGTSASQRVTVEKAAQLRGVSTNTIRRWIKDKQLEADKVNGRLIVTLDADQSATYQVAEGIPAVDVNRLMRERDAALRAADSAQAARDAQAETMNHLLPQMVRNIVEQMIPVLQGAIHSSAGAHIAQ